MEQITSELCASLENSFGRRVELKNWQTELLCHHKERVLPGQGCACAKSLMVPFSNEICYILAHGDGIQRIDAM